MYPRFTWRSNMLCRVCSWSVPNRTRTLELFPRMQTAEPLVLLRVPMDGRAASFRLQSGPEAGISRIKFAVIVIVRLDRATSASSPSTSASFTKGHFMRQTVRRSCPSIGFARAPPWPQYCLSSQNFIHNEYTSHDNAIWQADPTYPIERDETNSLRIVRTRNGRRKKAQPSRRRLAQPFGAAV